MSEYEYQSSLDKPPSYKDVLEPVFQSDDNNGPGTAVDFVHSQSRDKEFEKTSLVELEARRRIQLLNLVQTGIAFMFLLSSVQTALSVGTVVLNNVSDDKFQGSPTLGYKVLGATYLVLAAAYWIAQPIVAKLGSINSMVISCVCFIFFLVAFIRPLTWLLYLSALVAGFGSAVLSTAGGVFMALNSDEETIGRNTALFFGLYETSLIWGNLGFYGIVRGSTSISNRQRYTIFGFLLALALAGTILVAFLRRKKAMAVLQPSGFARSVDRGFFGSLKAAALLFLDVRILLLIPLIVYLGISSAFRNDIYNTSIGYTLLFQDLSLVGLAGVLLGVGELTGSALSGVINVYMPHLKRGKIVAIGLTFNFLAYLLVYLNIPSEADLAPTFGYSVIDPPNRGLAVFCSFLMGVGDAATNTQIYAILAELFGQDIVPPIGLFQSIYAIFCAVAYFYSTALKLYAQLIILIIVGLFGTGTFWWMSSTARRSLRYEDI